MLLLLLMSDIVFIVIVVRHCCCSLILLLSDVVVVVWHCCISVIYLLSLLLSDVVGDGSCYCNTLKNAVVALRCCCCCDCCRCLTLSSLLSLLLRLFLSDTLLRLLLLFSDMLLLLSTVGWCSVARRRNLVDCRPECVLSHLRSTLRQHQRCFGARRRHRHHCRRWSDVHRGWSRMLRSLQGNI